MTLRELQIQVARLLETQSPETETTVQELAVRHTGQPEHWRYIEAVSTERGLESAARTIEDTQRRMASDHRTT